MFFLCLSISLNCASIWNMKQHEARGVYTLNQTVPQISHTPGSDTPSTIAYILVAIMSAVSEQQFS